MMRKVVALLLGVVAVGGLSVPSAGAATTKKFCAAYKAFNVFYAAQYLDGDPSPEQLAAAQPRFDELADAVDASAPDVIADTVKVVTDAFRAGQAAVIDPTVSDAFDVNDQWAIEHCGYKVIDVTARDYAFRGVPKTLQPGFVAFDVKNAGTQDHGFAIVRIKGKETAAELTALPLDQAIQKVAIIAPTVTAAPGKTIVNFALITRPGRYGAVDPAFLAQKMYSEFTVKKR